MTTKPLPFVAPPRLLACVAGGALLLSLACSMADAQPATSAAPAKEVVLRMGHPRMAFADLNENDAVAAYRAFVTGTAQSRGFAVRPEVLVFDTLAEMETALRSGAIHVATFTSWHLVSTGPHSFEPAFMPVKSGSTRRRSLLLVRRDGGIRTLRDLHQRTVMLLRNSHTTLGEQWFETLCLAENIASPDELVGRLELVAKPSAAILPVFFQRADACIVDEQTFATAAELNPQLQRDLVELMHSEPMLDSVVCLSRAGWELPLHRENLHRSLAELHQQPSGRQILAMFRIEGLAPFGAADLDSVTALHARHQALTQALRELRARESQKTPPGATP